MRSAVGAASLGLLPADTTGVTSHPTLPGPRSTSDPFAVRRRIGEVLVDQGVLTEQQLHAMLRLQLATTADTPRRRLGEVVIEAGLASDQEVAKAIAGALNLSLIDLGRVVVNPVAVRSVPRLMAERNAILVLGQVGASVTIAAADPTNLLALDDVRLFTGAERLTVLVATHGQLREHLRRAWSLSEDSGEVSAMITGVELDEEPEDIPAQALESAPVVRLVDALLVDAVRARASDVHVEPQDRDLRIRYRVDGLLREVMTVPRSIRTAAVSRIKILAGLDIAERRRPQDGRAKFVVDGAPVEARVSTLPTLHGEKVVIRLLPPASSVPSLAELGLDEPQHQMLCQALGRNQGLVLITGPTGSGKTNTLYAAIQHLSTPERNIVTLEDPVEVQVAGITQVQVHERAGMTFARGLRSILRQDPDVVLVGEVRDQETAVLALQASLTGHLVLTTLHTNNAVSAITRLVDMGADPFLVASSLTLVLAQRLVRRPCRSCAIPDPPAADTLARLGLPAAELDGSSPRRGPGCADCTGTGYYGRIGIFEVLPITTTLRQVLLSTPTEAAVAAAARTTGMTTLRAAALAAAWAGHTTYEEVLRTTTMDTSTGACTACARPLAPAMACCPWCGTAVDSENCSRCQRKGEPNWRFCGWCQQPRAGA